MCVYTIFFKAKIKYKLNVKLFINAYKTADEMALQEISNG